MKSVDAREVPDPEVRVTRKQRQFSAEYKLEILARAEACTQRGELREMLEQEGLHSSYLSRWRRARAAGRLGGTRSQKRGPKLVCVKVIDTHQLSEHAKCPERH